MEDVIAVEKDSQLCYAMEMFHLSSRVSNVFVSIIV